MAPELTVITPTTKRDNGWGRYSNAVVKRLRSRYSVRLVQSLGDPVALRSDPIALLRAVRTVRRRSRNADALLSLVAYPYSLVALLATLGRSTAYFVSCHGSYAIAPLHDKHRTPAKLALTRAAQLFPVSTFTAEKIRLAVPGIDNITIVPNGVDAKVPEPDPFNLNHRVLLTVGAFKPRKGQLLALKAFTRVTDTLPDVEYHLVGSATGSYADRIRSVVRRCDVENKVHIEGRVNEQTLNRWYATADAFVLTPQYIDHHFEGFGLVYLEANRYGVPVIATRGTGAEDAVADGQSGLLVENDVGAIKEALQRVLTDEELRCRLQVGAREWADEHTWDRTVECIDTELRRYL